MCEQRRSTVTRVDMQGREPKEVWSVNLEGVKFYVTLLIGIFTLFGMVWAINQWSARNVFGEELYKFHTTAIPQIDARIAVAVERHHSEAMLTYERDMGGLKSELAVIRQHAEDLDSRFARIETKIDRLYYERFGKNG
jgi:hypothetical protein